MSERKVRFLAGLVESNQLCWISYIDPTCGLLWWIRRLRSLIHPANPPKALFGYWAFVFYSMFDVHLYNIPLFPCSCVGMHTNCRGCSPNGPWFQPGLFGEQALHGNEERRHIKCRQERLAVMPFNSFPCSYVGMHTVQIA